MTKSRQFEQGEFTKEEFERMDGLLGNDWTELSDDALVGRISKAMREVEVAKASAPTSMADFFARLQTQLEEALRTDLPPFDQHDLPQPDRRPGGPGFSSTAEPVSGPIPSSSPGDPRFMKGVGSFLDGMRKVSKADLATAVEEARTGRSPLGPKIETDVKKGRSPIDVVRKGLQPGMADTTEEQRVHIRSGQPASWLLDAPDNTDEKLIKSAGQLVSGVWELVRRSKAGQDSSATLN